VMALEAAVARIAIEWAAASAYATDALLEARTLDGIELLVVLQGLQPEPAGRVLAAGGPRAHGAGGPACLRRPGP
jgi:ATP-dependent helicase/nuclease subunit B